MLGYQKNFSKLTVSGNYSASDMVITISGSNLVSFVPNSGSGIFSVVWYDSTNYPAIYNDPNKEICRVTGVSGQSLFLERGMEYTSNSIHSGSTHKMICTPTARGFNNLYYFRNPEKSYYMHEDFLFPIATSVEGWSRAVNGQGQSSFGALNSQFSQTLGGMLIPGGTGQNWSLSFIYGADSYLFGSGLMVLEAMFYLGTIPTGDAGFLIGFHDSTTSLLGIDGVNFVFSGSNYLTRISNNSTRTTFDSSVSITTGWHKYNMVITSGFVSDFYVDDVKIISTTGFLPSGTNRTSALSYLYVRSSGNSEAQIITGIIDYVSLYKELQLLNADYQITGYNFRL